MNMPKQLTNVNLNEVSLVDAPASPEADILLAKSKKGILSMNIGDLFKKFGFKKALSMTEAKRASEISESVWALNTSLNSILGDDQLDDAGKAAKVEESIAQFLDLIKTPEGDTMSKAEMTTEEKAKAYDALMAKGDKAVCKNDGADGALDEVAKARLSTLETENAELKKKLGDAEEKQEADARLAKAKELTANLPSVKAEDLAGVLNGMTAEQTASLEGIVKTLGEQLKTSNLFKAVGQNSGAAADAQAQLDAKAQEIAKKDGVSIQKAFTKAAEENPELYKQVRSA